MNLVVRRRLAVSALLASSALVAGVLLAPSSSATTNGLTITPSAAANSETAQVLTFKGTQADFEFGGTATFTRVGGGQPFDVDLDSDVPPTGTNHEQTATVDFTDMGDGVGKDGPADAGVYGVSATGADDPTGLLAGGGNDTCASCFTVLAAGPIALTSVTPSSLRPNSSGNITLTGNNFERGVKIEFLFNDGSVDPLITANAAPKNSSGADVVDKITTAKQIMRTATVGADAPGSRGIRVTNLDGTTASCTTCFFVAGPPLTSISPTGGDNNPSNGPVTVTFNGTNVVDGEPRLEFAGNPGSSTRDGLTIIGSKNAPSNGTSMTATFDLRDAAPGQYQAVVRDTSSGVTNACEQPSCAAFTVTQTNRTPPTVTSLDRDPNVSGAQKDQVAGTTKTFDVAGTNFSKGVVIATAATNVTVTSVEFVNPTLVRATIQATKDAKAGDYDVTATLTNGSASAACAKCYTVTAAASPTPSASVSASPCPTPSALPSSSASASAPASGSASPKASASASSSASASPSPSGGGGGLPTLIAIPAASDSATPSASASATVSPSASASASTSPSASSSASASASSSPTNNCNEAKLSISAVPTDIVPNQASTVHVHGAPNRIVDLYAYSRPNTTYGVVRSGSLNANGDISWNVTPGGNTRLYAHYRNGTTTTATSDSPSTVIEVHTSLSLSAYRDGVRKYHFQGTNLPRRPGQLITLYRYATGPNLDKYCVPTAESDTTNKADGSCHAIITSQAKTGSNSQWRIDRTFTGNGQFYFVVRTSQNINNGRGHSNQRLTVIH